MKFFWGMLIGGAIALIFAPARGEETRQRLLEKAGEVADASRRKAQEAVDSGREKVGDMGKREAEDAYSKAALEVSGGSLR